MLGTPVKVYNSLGFKIKMFKKEKDHTIKNTELSQNKSLILLTSEKYKSNTCLTGNV